MKETTLFTKILPACAALSVLCFGLNAQTKKKADPKPAPSVKKVAPKETPKSAADKKKPSAPAVEQPAILKEGSGFNGIVVGRSTVKDVEKKFGGNYKSIKHKKYSLQMQYPNGLSFYACQADPQRRVFDIEVRAPFAAQTSKGVVLSKSTVDDIRKIYGKKRGKSATEDLEYRGVSFYYAPFQGKKVVSVIDIVENAGIRQCREAK